MNGTPLSARRIDVAASWPVAIDPIHEPGPVTTSPHAKTFAVGVEMRLPLGGGIKGRNELAAAKLRKQQALVSLKDVETQMLNAIDTAIRKVGSARQATQNYETIVNFNRNLLDTELARLAVGKVESRK